MNEGYSNTKNVKALVQLHKSVTKQKLPKEVITWIKSYLSEMESDMLALKRALHTNDYAILNHKSAGLKFNSEEIISLIKKHFDS